MCKFSNSFNGNSTGSVQPQNIDGQFERSLSFEPCDNGPIALPEIAHRNLSTVENPNFKEMLEADNSTEEDFNLFDDVSRYYLICF